MQFSYHITTAIGANKMPSVVNVHLQAPSLVVRHQSIVAGRVPIRPIHRHLRALDHKILPVVQVRKIGVDDFTIVNPGHIGASRLSPIQHVSHCGIEIQHQRLIAETYPYAFCSVAMRRARVRYIKQLLGSYD
jgi:hypothetical protein